MQGTPKHLLRRRNLLCCAEPYDKVRCGTRILIAEIGIVVEVLRNPFLVLCSEISRGINHSKRVAVGKRDFIGARRKHCAAYRVNRRIPAPYNTGLTHPRIVLVHLLHVSVADKKEVWKERWKLRKRLCENPTEDIDLREVLRRQTHNARVSRKKCRKA